MNNTVRNSQKQSLMEEMTLVAFELFFLNMFPGIKHKKETCAS